MRESLLSLDLQTNPHHRILTAPVASAAFPRIALPVWLNTLRWVMLAFVFALFLFFLTLGTMESRVTYLLAFALAFINPIWAFYVIALMGPLFLMDQAKTHMLAGLEVLTLGMIGAELRLLDQPPSRESIIDPVTGSVREQKRILWGVWPHYLLGLFLLLLASSFVGMHLVFLKEQMPGGLQRINFHLRYMFYGAATEPEWVAKSLWNWTTGMIVAVIAARRMDAITAARWLKLGGISLLVACGVALLNWAGVMDLSHIRRINPDPLQAGRLQGLAGHPGWFGQWIILMWPGLLLWWSHGRSKRNAVLVAGLAVVGLALVLTAARAAWLGAGIAGFIGGIYLLRTFPGLRRYLPHTLIALGAVVIIGFFVGGETLQTRLVHLLRVQDRVNYYVTGLIFLREYPFGLGLGTHYQFYDWMITPYFHWYQFDHVTAHSLWLHTLIENGPFVPLVLAAGVAGVVAEVLKSRRLLDVPQRTIVVALALSLLGLLAVSVAQYVVYLRVVELCLWIGAGTVLGLCRSARCRVPEGDTIGSTRGQKVLLLCGVCALLMFTMNSGRDYVGRVPRHFNYSNEGLIEFWTGSEWRTPVSNDVGRISFSLLRKHIPVQGTVIWPDGRKEDFEIAPGEYRYFEFTRRPVGQLRPFDSPQWLIIEANPLWTPAEYEESNDRRGLGVYVSGLKME